MKKYYRPVITAFLVMILCVSLAGCSCGKKNETTNNSEVTVNNEKSSGSGAGETAPAADAEAGNEDKEGTDSSSDKTQPSVNDSKAGEAAGSTLEGTIEAEAGEMPEGDTDVQEEVVIELEEGYASGGM